MGTFDNYKIIPQVRINNLTDYCFLLTPCVSERGMFTNPKRSEKFDDALS